MTETRDRLVKDWIAHSNTSWAYNELCEIVSRSHDEAWPIVFQIAKMAPSDEVLGALAVGPMEDMLSAHADSYLELIEQETNCSPNLKRALLMGIRITGPGSDRIQQFIDKIGKESIDNGWNPNL